MALTRVVDAASEAVTLEDARTWLRLDDLTSDQEILQCVKDARHFTEEQTGRIIGEQQWQLTLPRFPMRRIELPLYPIVSVQTVAYRDDNENELTVSDWRLDDRFIYSPKDEDWPSESTHGEAVTVSFTAGNDAVDGGLRRAVLYLARHFFDDRDGAAPPDGYEAMISPYRIPVIA